MSDETFNDTNLLCAHIRENHYATEGICLGHETDFLDIITIRESTGVSHESPRVIVQWVMAQQCLQSALSHHLWGVAGQKKVRVSLILLPFVSLGWVNGSDQFAALVAFVHSLVETRRPTLSGRYHIYSLQIYNDSSPRPKLIVVIGTNGHIKNPTTSAELGVISISQSFN